MKKFIAVFAISAIVAVNMSLIITDSIKSNDNLNMSGLFSLNVAHAEADCPNTHNDDEILKKTTKQCTTVWCLAKYESKDCTAATGKCCDPSAQTTHSCGSPLD